MSGKAIQSEDSIDERPLRDRIIIVTGGGRGLGRAHALLLARLGATVTVCDAGVDPAGEGSDPEPARLVAQEISADGSEADWVAADLRSAEACRGLVAGVLDKFGRVDGLVHSAGIVDRTSIDNMGESELRRTLAINLDAAVWLCQAVLPGMRTRGYGRIVLTSSGHGLYPLDPPALPAYALGKAAQVGLMNALALEEARHGILINAIAPVAATRVYTGPEPERLGPELVSPAVAYLVSPQCRDTGLVVRAAGGEFSIGGYSVTAGVTLSGPVDYGTFVERWSSIVAGDYTPTHRATGADESEPK